MAPSREFGNKISGRTYIVRPGVYAAIVDERKRIAAIHGTGGCFLPGGGVKSGETPEEALGREVWEECGARITLGRQICAAVDFIVSESEGACFEKRGRFFMAQFTTRPTREVIWIPYDALQRSFRQDGHAWAASLAVDLQEQEGANQRAELRKPR